MNTNSSESQLEVVLKLSSAASSLDVTALLYPVLYTALFNNVINSSHLCCTLTLFCINSAAHIPASGLEGAEILSTHCNVISQFATTYTL